MSMPAVVELDEYGLQLAWTRIPPGPELAGHLDAADWSAMSDRELVAAMDAARRQATWAQALMLESVAEVSRRRHEADPYGGSDAHRRVCGEVSLELTIPAGQAEELVAMAETLPAALPHTWAAMRTGEIDYDRALVMVDGITGLDPVLARRLDAELAAEAADITKTLLRRRLTRAIKRADPEAYAEQTKIARDERRVEVWDNDNETCDLIGRNLAAVDAHAIYNRLTAAAQAMRSDGDTRPINQIRLDLFRNLLRGIPLPEATRIPDDEEGGTGRDDNLGRADQRPDQRPGRAPAPPTSAHPDAAADLIAAVEKQIAQALAETADEALTGLLDRAHAEGHLDGLPRLVGHAAQTMREALGPIVDAWCRVTSTSTGTSTSERFSSSDRGRLITA